MKAFHLRCAALAVAEESLDAPRSELVSTEDSLTPRFEHINNSVVRIHYGNLLDSFIHDGIIQIYVLAGENTQIGFASKYEMN